MSAQSNSRVADVVVIGGGIIGAACAYYLSKEGLKVYLLERGFPCSGASGACEGLILLWDKAPGPELELGKASSRLWRQLAEELDLDIEYDRGGSILVAEDETGLKATKEKLQELERAGVQGLALDALELLELEPSLARDMAGGVLFPNDAHLEPRRATLALLQAAKRMGLALRTSAPLMGIVLSRQGRVEAVQTAETRLATHVLVNAAGAWSPEIGKMVGISIPVLPRKGHIIVMEKAPLFIRRPLLEAGYTASLANDSLDLSVAMVVKGTRSGTILLGSSRQFAGFDKTVDLGVINAIALRAIRFFPKLIDLKAIRTYAGLRPYSPDHLPIIGPVPGIEGFYLATGHEGAGICLAPITGQLIAQWVSGKPMDLPPESFHPGRFIQRACQSLSLNTENTPHSGHPLNP